MGVEDPVAASTGHNGQTRPADWSAALAPRLFSPPPRWGWQAADVATTEPRSAPAPVGARPVWVDLLEPDTSQLYGPRQKAIRRLIWRAAITAILLIAFLVFQPKLKEQVDKLGGDAKRFYGYALLVVGLLLLLLLLTSIAAVRRTSAAIRAFRKPHLAARQAERQLHANALREWENATRQFEADSAATAQRQANGPLWFPVQPASEPTRLDVFGGDPRRNGWASLLVTIGSSLLARSRRILVVDLTGLDVGGGLVAVARATGRPARCEVLDDGVAPDLLGSIPSASLPSCLARVLTERAEQTDIRHERSFAAEVLRMVIDVLDEPISFARLAAGLRVLRQGRESELLTPAEVGALITRIGDIDQNEWTTRNLRLWASELDVLDRLSSGPARAPLFSGDELLVIATPGGHDDRKELIDRMIVESVQEQLRHRYPVASLLVVAGADHLGAATLTSLADHALRADLQLALLIDQPHGDIEKHVGTGGAVCIMKMYNHRDATVAAEFVGKGYKFVMSQLTRQVGKSFTDGGGDNFSAATTMGTNQARRTTTTDSRGHTWAASRSWSIADNVGTSTGSNRVYEFIVDPQELLALPETAFILVDNSGQGRRVLLADANPGICLMDRVSTTTAT